MARDFSKNTSNTLSLGAAAIGPLLDGASAISVHVWALADTFDAGVNDNSLVAIIINSTATSGLTLRVDGSVAPKVLRVGGRSVSTDSFQARNATTEFATGAWHSCGGVLNIGGDTITPYFNGVAEGGGAATFNNATYTQGTATDNDYIGAANTLAAAVQFDGRLAELAIWTNDIGAGNFASLAKGFSAALIAPASLVYYGQLIGRYSPEIDVVGGKNGTISGTVGQADHPRIVYPQPGVTVFHPAVAANTQPPRSMHQYRLRRVA